MANRPTYHQDRYFYSPLWSKEETVFLIEALVSEKNAGRWVWNGQNGDAIGSVKDLINSRFNRNFDIIGIHQRVRLMRCRYRIFYELVSRSDVHWDEDENVVYASPVTWDILRQEYPLTNAYIYQGEPLYESLKLLFKPDGNESDEEPDDVPVVIDAPPNFNNAGPSAPTTTNSRQPLNQTPMIRRGNVILNFHSDDSDSST